MKKLIQVSAALAASLATPALAADLPVKAPVAPVVAPYNWTGFYVGANLGGAWGKTQYTDPLAPAGVANTFNTDPDGFIGGGQVGLNYQIGPWVFGVEGEFSWSKLRGSGRGPVTPPAGSTLDTDANWIATAAGRVGYASDRWLFYVKGGAAWINVDHSFSNIGPPAFTTSVRETHNGWTVGTGIEWAFARTWSAKVEYDYMDFGTDSLVFSALGFPFLLDVKQQIHAVKFGVNYRL